MSGGECPEGVGPIRIHDITLREGLQAADIALDLSERTALGVALAEAGVDFIQTGFAGRDDDVTTSLKERVANAQATALLVGFDDDWSSALESSVAAGVDVVQILLRAGTRQLKAMGISRETIAVRTKTIVSEVITLGARPWYIPSFGTSADESFLFDLCDLAANTGAEAVFVVDTLGIATPERIERIVRRLKLALGDTAVGIHAHDDFGLAMANTLAAVRGGAEIVEASVNGYGERAGNCSTGEIALALDRLYSSPTGIELRRLYALEHLASRLTRVSIPGNQPISGANVFAQKLDIHVQLTRDDPTLMEPFPPDTVGASRFLRLGLGTGPTAVNAKLVELHRSTVPEERAMEIAEAIRATAVSQKRAVTAEEFLEIVNRVS